jgi:hypothetical protein
MKSILWIVHTESTPSLHGDVGHLITVCCSNKFQVDLDLKLELFREKFSRDPNLLDRGRVGVFNNLEELRLYSFELAERLGVDQLNIHAATGLNTILSEVNDISEFKEKMNQGGEIIPIESSKQSGLWGRIFN